MSDKLQQAIAAIKSGDKQAGRQILKQVLQSNPSNETAWLWMSQVLNKREDKIKCLKRVVKINPNNEVAKLGLTKLQPKQIILEKEIEPPQKPEKTQATKNCPYCAETIKAEAIICRFCGKDLQPEQKLALMQQTTIMPPEEDRILIDREVAKFNSYGWQIISRTETSVQLKKPRQWNAFLLVITVPLLCAGGIGILTFVFAIIDYLLQKEKLVHFTANDIRGGYVPDPTNSNVTTNIITVFIVVVFIIYLASLWLLF